jgi:hypothetical protein
VANFKVFNEGINEIAATGMPGTLYFELIDGDADSTAVTDTLSSGTQTSGTATKSQSEPTPVGRVVTFTSMTWTETSGSPKAVRCLTSARGGGGKAICVWNLNNGAAVNLATAAPVTVNSLAFMFKYQGEA